MKECENCENKHNGEYGSGRFCSSKCARGFSTKAKRKEINEKVSLTMTGKKGPEMTYDKRIEINKKISLKMTGKSHSEETKNKIRESNKKYTNVLKNKKCKYCTEYKQILIHSIICTECKDPYRLYKEQCSFKFNIFDYPEIFNLSLIKEHGFYSPSNSKLPNLNGISRDHIFSISEGFRLKIDPNIISHPMNCKLMKHCENNKKNKKCDITIEELEEKIKHFKQMPI